MPLVNQRLSFLFFSDIIPGSVVDIDEIFPPRPAPMKRGTTDVPQTKSLIGPSVAGLCTPDNGNNVIRNPTAPQVQRIGTTVVARDPLYVFINRLHQASTLMCII